MRTISTSITIKIIALLLSGCSRFSVQEINAAYNDYWDNNFERYSHLSCKELLMEKTALLNSSGGGCPFSGHTSNYGDCIDFWDLSGMTPKSYKTKRDVKIDMVDEAIKSCKSESNKITINNKNNININNNEKRNPSSKKVTKQSDIYKQTCGEKGEICYDIGFVEEKKGNVDEARRLYRMACLSGHKLSCKSVERLKKQ